MSIGYSGPREISEQNLVTIGRFMHRCGIFEAAIDAFLNKYKLTETEEFKKLSKKGWAPLNKKIELLNKYCISIKEKTSNLDEAEKAKNIIKGVEKYKRPN